MTEDAVWSEERLQKTGASPLLLSTNQSETSSAGGRGSLPVARESSKRSVSRGHIDQ